LKFKPKKDESRLRNYLNRAKKPGKKENSTYFGRGKAYGESRLDNISLPYSVPSKIFQNRSYSILETLAVYLKDEIKLNYHQIGILLKRNERTIWTCYNRAKQKKFEKSFEYPESIQISFKIFHNRKISFSEALIRYLKDEIKLSYHQIGVLINRNDRTIWTLYSRVLEKTRGEAK